MANNNLNVFDFFISFCFLLTVGFLAGVGLPHILGHVHPAAVAVDEGLHPVLFPAIEEVARVRH